MDRGAAVGRIRPYIHAPQHGKVSCFWGCPLWLQSGAWDVRSGQCLLCCLNLYACDYFWDWTPPHLNFNGTSPLIWREGCCLEGRPPPRPAGPPTLPHGAHLGAQASHDDSNAVFCDLPLRTRQEDSLKGGHSDRIRTVDQPAPVPTLPIISGPPKPFKKALPHPPQHEPQQLRFSGSCIDFLTFQ